MVGMETSCQEPMAISLVTVFICVWYCLVSSIHFSAPCTNKIMSIFAKYFLDSWDKADILSEHPYLAEFFQTVSLDTVTALPTLHFFVVVFDSLNFSIFRYQPLRSDLKALIESCSSPNISLTSELYSNQCD